MNLNQFIITGVYLGESDQYYFTSEGIFNKKWYRRGGVL
jgi:hypothetical protein